MGFVSFLKIYANHNSAKRNFIYNLLIEGKALSQAQRPLRAKISLQKACVPIHIRQNTEITLYTYEIQKLFKYGGKNNHFTSSDITGIHVEFSNFKFGDNCLCKMYNKYTKIFLFKRLIKCVILLQLVKFYYLYLHVRIFPSLKEFVEWCKKYDVMMYTVCAIFNVMNT